MTEATKGALLIVDDEPLKRVTLKIELSEAGYQVHEASDAHAALKQLAAQPVDVVVTDLRMPGLDGMQFLSRIKEQSPRTHVILMTAYGSVDSAVEAIKRGAYDYLTKPFTTDVLLAKLERLRLGEPFASGSGPSDAERLGPLLGRSFAARALLEQIRQAAGSEQAVLIQGERGTGKGLVAETVHQLSRRSPCPLVVCSCGGTRAEQLEQHLFGSAAGAGPSAPSEPGRLEAARDGTLVLDDVDVLPLDLQAKLLRVLEAKALERATNGQRVPFNARAICATRHDLRQWVDQGRFCEDLYYRLSAISLSIPPLRDRREDIPLLAEEFLRQTASRLDRPAVSTRIHPHALEALTSYHWPGNVRELQCVIERAAAAAQGAEIERRHVVLPDQSLPSQAPPPESAAPLTDTVASVERTLIDAALRRAAGNQARAAQFLGIPRTTLRDKMAKYGMVGGPSGRS